MSGVELVLAFLTGVVMGGALNRWLLPPLVDCVIHRLRRHGRRVVSEHETRREIAAADRRRAPIVRQAIDAVSRWLHHPTRVVNADRRGANPDSRAEVPRG